MEQKLSKECIFSAVCQFSLYIKKFMTWVSFLFAYFIRSFDCDHFFPANQSPFPKFYFFSTILNEIFFVDFFYREKISMSKHLYKYLR